MYIVVHYTYFIHICIHVILESIDLLSIQWIYNIKVKQFYVHNNSLKVKKKKKQLSNKTKILLLIKEYYIHADTAKNNKQENK